MKKVALLFLCAVLHLAAFAKVKVEKNIGYSNDKNDSNRQLNVYYKKGVVNPQDVIIFIHGGSWSSGKKETYWWLGRNMARKGIVTVVINYGLAPENKYQQMAADCTEAVKWVKEHISEYGGNPNRIFLMGHSAGGHLAELINADPQYFAAAGLKNPVRGVILDDAFGLDMNEYLTHSEKDANYYNFLRTFSASPQTWTMASPLHYLTQIQNPHLIFYGGRTYPAIQIQSKRMQKELQEHQVRSELQEIKNKKHVGMISQMIFGCNPLYDDILEFIKNN